MPKAHDIIHYILCDFLALLIGSHLKVILLMMWMTQNFSFLRAIYLRNILIFKKFLGRKILIILRTKIATNYKETTNHYFPCKSDLLGFCIRQRHSHNPPNQTSSPLLRPLVTSHFQCPRSSSQEFCSAPPSSWWRLANSLLTAYNLNSCGMWGIF